jgi:hypothetical protein
MTLLARHDRASDYFSPLSPDWVDHAHLRLSSLMVCGVQSTPSGPPGPTFDFASMRSSAMET